MTITYCKCCGQGLRKTNGNPNEKWRKEYHSKCYYQSQTLYWNFQNFYHKAINLYCPKTGKMLQ